MLRRGSQTYTDGESGGVGQVELPWRIFIVIMSYPFSLERFGACIVRIPLGN